MVEVEQTELAEVLLIRPKTFDDDRGYFRQSWNAEQYAAIGITGPFVQDNLSISKPGVLRGMHLQNPNLQSKLVSAPQGEIFDVAVDVRVGSPDFGKWVGVRLTADGGEQLFVPRGFAHGFCVIKGPALVTYKVDGRYDPSAEKTIRWDDPEIGIAWPENTWDTSGPVLSESDRNAPFLSALPEGSLPSLNGGS
jgi:dTDP-4-dehydrorhamnose 3,5-epimerase